MSIANTLTKPTNQGDRSPSLGRISCLLGSVLLVLSAAANAQAASLSPFVVEYDVGNNLVTAGSATLRLEQKGTDWKYSLKTKPKGVFKLTGKGKIEEVSEFGVESSAQKLTLLPKSYKFRQDNVAKRSVDAVFNLDTNVLTHTTRGKSGTETISRPLLDRLSATLSVVDALRTSDFSETEIEVFDNGKIKKVLFSNEGSEDVKTKSGLVKTIRVKSRTANSSSNRHTLTWFAPELDYVPIKMEQYKRDSLVARLTLKRLKNKITESGGAQAFAK